MKGKHITRGSLYLPNEHRDNPLNHAVTSKDPMAPPNELSATSRVELLDDARSALQTDNRTNFRVVCLVSDLSWKRLVDIARGRFEVTEQGEFYQLYNTHTKRNQTNHVYLYLYQHPATGAPIIFTLNSSEDLNETLDRMVANTEDLYTLWLPPDEMGDLREDILDITGLELTGFEYDTFGRDQRYEAQIRPGFQRSGSHDSKDAEHMLEEWTVKYGVTATRLRFKLATRGTFRFSNDGEFVLENGSTEFLYEDIVEPALEKVHPLNELMKAADLSVATDNGFEHIEEHSIEISITDPLDYEDREEFTSEMQEEDFYPYSAQAAEGSLLFNGRIADERNDGIISVSTDGEDMMLLPRYDSGFDSLVRFYRFLVEKIDPDTEIVTAEI